MCQFLILLNLIKSYFSCSHVAETYLGKWKRAFIKIKMCEKKDMKDSKIIWFRKHINAFSNKTNFGNFKDENETRWWNSEEKK